MPTLINETRSSIYGITRSFPAPLNVSEISKMLQRRERKGVAAIGKVFKALRKEKKLSAFALGLELGMSYDTIYDWENGHREIMMGNFLAICRVLGVLPSEVLKLVEAIDKPTG